MKFGSARVPRPRRIGIESPPKFKLRLKMCKLLYPEIYYICNILHLRPHNKGMFLLIRIFKLLCKSNIVVIWIQSILNWRPNPVIRPGQTRSWSAKPAYQRVLNDFFYIEDQAFLRSYDSAPRSPPLPSASCPSFSVFLCVAGQAYWRVRGGGGGCGRGAKLYDREKAWTF